MCVCVWKDKLMLEDGWLKEVKGIPVDESFLSSTEEIISILVNLIFWYVSAYVGCAHGSSHISVSAPW